ncbi:hypothetical protein Q3G72_008296 [Acer saccharum]|nr:hypothetical protein Q3G72_008296 [Acer saccharum]
MDELLKRARMYEYEDDGKKPQPENEAERETKPYAIDAGGDVTFVEDAFDKSQQSPIPSTSNVSGPQHEQIKAANPQEKNQTENKKEEISEIDKKESPILIAAKNGITEIVEKILEKFPVALHDMNYQKKNVVLLAAENRQTHVYQLLLRMNENSAFRHVDHEGNSALHLAAKLGDYNSWLIHGDALQMHWEIKWYEV